MCVNHVKITAITLTEYMELSFCGYHSQNDFFYGFDTNKV